MPWGKQQGHILLDPNPRVSVEKEQSLGAPGLGWGWLGQEAKVQCKAGGCSGALERRELQLCPLPDRGGLKSGPAARRQWVRTGVQGERQQQPPKYSTGLLSQIFPISGSSFLTLKLDQLQEPVKCTMSRTQQGASSLSWTLHWKLPAGSEWWGPPSPRLWPDHTADTALWKTPGRSQEPVPAILSLQHQPLHKAWWPGLS